MGEPRASLRVVVLYVAKYLGMFRVSRYFTRRALRILCYHGGAIADEHLFSPGTFMTEETFRRRMRMLKSQSYPVLGFNEALQRLSNHELPDCATSITIDDGWYGTYALLVPVLRQLGLPATLYVTSYYVVKQTQVFNMYVRYLLWCHSDRSIDLARVDANLAGRFSLAEPEDRDAAYKRIEGYAEKALDAPRRQQLAERIGRELGHDVKQDCSSRVFSLMTGDEIRELGSSGIDVQLHTHRHCLPLDPLKMESEIAENRSILSKFTDGDLKHLCYPSGDYSEEQFPGLDALRIQTATTTLPGFNYPGTPRLELRRFLDSERFTDIEFEAELAGFIEFIRLMRKMVRSGLEREAP